MDVRCEIINEHALLYRVGSGSLGGEGLWYDRNGIWTGKIRSLSEGHAGKLPMGLNPIFRAEGRCWVSATDSLAGLRKWFSVRDMTELLPQDYRVLEVEVFSYRRLHFETYSHEVFSAHQVYRTKAIDPSRLYPSLILAENAA